MDLLAETNAVLVGTLSGHGTHSAQFLNTCIYLISHADRPNSLALDTENSHLLLVVLHFCVIIFQRVLGAQLYHANPEEHIL